MTTAPVLTVRGLRVPWVTRWTSEVRNDGGTMTPTGVAYRDETPGERVLDVLWLRHNDSPGEGEPQWKTVHTYRQRDAMLGPCCQVCGRVIEGKVTWLMPLSMLAFETHKGRIKTSTPPTCEDCIEIAQSSCPHLGDKGSVVLDVRHYRHWGVFGDAFLPSTAGKALHTMIDVPFGDDRLKYVMAKQLVVEIFDWRKRR